MQSHAITAAQLRTVQPGDPQTLQSAPGEKLGASADGTWIRHFVGKVDDDESAHVDFIDINCHGFRSRPHETSREELGCNHSWDAMFE